MFTRIQEAPGRAGWLTVIGVATLVLAGCASTPAPSSGEPATSGPLHTASSPLGQIVVDGAGMTAYVFDNDVAGSGSSACTGACATQWPAITSTSATPEVDGITGAVGTIDAANGRKQVTLNGLPLYTYAGDTAAGDTSGQGFGGIWWVVDPTGAEITEAPATDDRGY
jgi:predicted lipoprotein with Yx(FWY)xxD motif